MMKIWHVGLPSKIVVDAMLERGLRNHMMSAWSWFESNRGRPQIRETVERIHAAGGQVFIDSGALSALRADPAELSWLERQSEIAVLAAEMRADVVSHLDVPMERRGLANARISRDEAMQTTIRNARSFMDLDVGQAKKVYVIQGWELHEYENCVDEYADLGIPDGDNLLGLGTCCMRLETRGLWQIAERVRQLTQGTQLHAFGVGDPAKIPRLARIGFDSVDEGNTVRCIIYGTDRRLAHLLETYRGFDA